MISAACSFIIETGDKANGEVSHTDFDHYYD